MLLIVRPCPRPPRFYPLLLARRPRCGHGSHEGGGGSGQGGSRRSGGGAKYRPISIFQSNFCHSCFRAFYTTIGQSYIPTTFSLENVFIYLFHKFFPLASL